MATPDRSIILSSENQFLLLLVTTILPVLLMPLADWQGQPAERFLMPVLYSLLILQLVRTLPREARQKSGRAHRYSFQVMAVVTALLGWIPALWWSAPLAVQLLVVSLLAGFFTLASYRLVRLLARVPSVNLPVLAGAAAGYINLGITGGLIAMALQLWNPATFPMGTTPPAFWLDRLTYFSFITLGGVGYGDVLPGTPTGERFSILLSICGNLYTALLIGILLGRYLSSPGRN